MLRKFEVNIQGLAEYIQDRIKIDHSVLQYIQGAMKRLSWKLVAVLSN